MKKEKVCIVGLGYIGLPTAALLANNGYKVHGVDVNEKVVEIINKGEIHIVEPDLDSHVTAAVAKGNLKADTKPNFADVFIIAVPTPFQEGYKPNIDYVLLATESIAPFVKSGNIVILESTSPVGTTAKVRAKLESLGINTNELFIAYCPERVLPGRIMLELVENDRIVGGINQKSTDKVVTFYKSFVKGEVLSTNARTAELCKLTENSYRDVNIAFANELSLICTKADINVWELISLANRHPRVKILQPGPGVGGHCIAVDPWFIVSEFPEESKLIKVGREVNNYKTEWVVKEILEAVTKFELKNNRKPKVACLGLAFKPDIDDLRESPALEIVLQLVNQCIDVYGVEPNIDGHESISLLKIEEVTKKADIICYLVKHKQFNSILSAEELRNKVQIDFCGIKNY